MTKSESVRRSDSLTHFKLVRRPLLPDIHGEQTTDWNSKLRNKTPHTERVWTRSSASHTNTA